jgi:hypothetical protein
MKLLELYKSLLKTGSMVTTQDGYVSFQNGDSTKPATVKGKRLVLPTPEHLANPDWKERVVFHPLSENIMRGESVVLEEFRSSINTKLNYIIGLLAYQLIQIATSVGDHSKLSPDQLEFLSKLKNADDKTMEAFQKLLAKMSVDQKHNAFISIYLKRGGTVLGKRHSRVGIVTFPFYSELVGGATEVYGIKLRVKDRETFINLMEYMFPVIGVAEAHNRGSDSTVAPYLDALMKSVMAISSPINDQVMLFSTVIDNSDSLLIEDGWVETFDNLEVMVPEIRMIPMQAGNEGAAANAKEVVSGTDNTVVAPVNPVPAWQQMIVPHQQYNAPVVHSGPVRTASGGLDFQSILNSNPVLAQLVGGGNNQPTYGRSPERDPRWAGNGFNSSQPVNNGSSWGNSGSGNNLNNLNNPRY